LAILKAGGGKRIDLAGNRAVIGVNNRRCDHPRKGGVRFRKDWVELKMKRESIGHTKCRSGKNGEGLRNGDFAENVIQGGNRPY